MELDQLRYFKTVAELGSVTRSAEQLNITQPALSKAITRLENELGIPLFDRKGNRIEINSYGRMFLRRVDRCLSELTDGVHELQAAGGLEQGQIVMAVTENIHLAYLLQEFLTANSNVRLQLQLQAPDQIQQNLLDGRLDFAVCTSELRHPELLWQPLYHDRASVLLSSDHPLAGQSTLQLEQLRNERFVIANSAGSSGNYTTKLCTAAGFSPQILLESFNTDLTGILAASGTAVSIAPCSVTYAQLISGQSTTVRSLPIIPLVDDPCPQFIGLVSRPGHFLSSAARALMDDISDYYQNRLPDAWST